MKKSRQKLSALSSLFFALASVSAVVALFSSAIFPDTALLEEVPQEFSGVYPLRSFFFALSSVIFVTAVVKLKSQGDDGAILQNRSTTSRSWGELTLSVEHPASRTIFSITVQDLIVWLVLLLSLLFLFLFLFKPSYFSRLSMEDHVIETFSAILLFIGCGVFIRIFTKLLCSHRRTNLVYPILSLAFALSLFVMGMEEISWFQRILLIDTPQAFEGNVQGELNLHNFATNFFHTAYFFLAFILFVLLPFLNEKTFFFKNSCLFAFFIPSRFVLFASAIFVAYTYGNWSDPLPQLSFFITLFILIHYAWVLRSVDNKLLLPTLVAIYVLTQSVFLVFGDFVKPWEIGEYKEFFIPLSFVIYSLEILHRTNTPKYCDAQKTI